MATRSGDGAGGAAMTGGPADAGGPGGPVFDPPLSLPTPPPVEGEDGGHRKRVAVGLRRRGRALRRRHHRAVAAQQQGRRRERQDRRHGRADHHQLQAPTNDRTRSLVAPVFAPFTFSASGVANTTTVPAGNPNGSLPSVSPKTLAALAGVVAQGATTITLTPPPPVTNTRARPDAGRAEQPAAGHLGPGHVDGTDQPPDDQAAEADDHRRRTRRPPPPRRRRTEPPTTVIDTTTTVPDTHDHRPIPDTTTIPAPDHHRPGHDDDPRHHDHDGGGDDDLVRAADDPGAHRAADHPGAHRAAHHPGADRTADDARPRIPRDAADHPLHLSRAPRRPHCPAPRRGCGRLRGGGQATREEERIGGPPTSTRRPHWASPWAS